MNTYENNPLGRSVEHMIPNAFLTRKRNKGEGDFYACRTCNIRKSDIDYVLGVISKSQSNDLDLVYQSFQKALDDPTRSKPFNAMLSTAETHDDCVSMKIPISACKLSQYVDFLAKGQYFKMTRKFLSLNLYIVDFQIINKLVIDELKRMHYSQHGTNPLEAIQEQPATETIRKGESIIFSQDEKSFIFFLHGGIGFTVKIVKRSRKSETKKKKYLSLFDS